ncbi:MAG TPA: DnaJ domain-containing protein [Polyangia bacterium]|nr:DnaJ domain-containing protein [Polyangia bacterium]
MSNEKKSFYEVLGVERAADERTIKKAYFTLVRKYPPETHPEEFKRVREAYEVLSNPVSRKDYDSIDQYDQYGEQISAQLKAGMEAMEAGDFKTAQRQFIEILRQQPQLHFARDLLGMAYLNSDQPKEALDQFVALVTAQPQNAVYHLHKGYAHYHQKQYVPAMDAYRTAQGLDAADTRVLVAMADCLSAQKQYEAALAELDKAINMDGQVDFQDFVFFMRKVQIQLLRNRADLAEKDLDQIFQILPPDPETRKYVATRLASLAADLFAMKRSVDANRMLQRCKQLDPSRKSMEFQFPSKVTVPIAVLPAGAQTWLANHGKEWQAGKLAHNAWGGPVLLLIVAGITALAAFNAGFNTRHLWDAQTQVFMALFLTGAALFLALGIRRIKRVSGSPYKKYTTIHPLHLLQVDVDKVTVWPLVNLHDVSLTHHSTNGVYQYTAVRMDFAGTVCNTTIRGQQASVDWANRLLGQRRRCLELMSMGLLEAEEGMDLIPPDTLRGSTKAPVDKAARDRAMRFYGIAALVGVVASVIAIPYNRGAAEREAYRLCSSYSSIQEYRNYLDRFPSGKHAGEVRGRINAKYDDAIARYKSKATAGDPKGVQAVVDVVNALRNSDSRRVKITYASSFDFSRLKNLPPKYGDVTQPDTAFSESQNKSRETSITSALRKAFNEALGYDVMDFDDGGYGSSEYGYDAYGHYGRQPAKSGPVTFVVKYKVEPSGSIYESTTGSKKKLFGVLFNWDFSIKFDNETDARYTLALRSAPEKNISYTTYGDYDRSSEIVPYTKMAESAFNEFSAKLEAGIGVASARPAVDNAAAVDDSPDDSDPAAMSPALQKALNDMAKNRKLDPATQKLLDDIRKMNPR